MINRLNILKRRKERNAVRLARLVEIEALDVKIGKIDSSLNFAWSHLILKNSAHCLESEKMRLQKKRVSLKGVRVS